jgi:hypothetical protein
VVPTLVREGVRGSLMSAICIYFNITLKVVKLCILKYETLMILFTHVVFGVNSDKFDVLGVS